MVQDVFCNYTVAVGHIAFYEIQMIPFPLSLEADLAPSLCKQDDQGLAKGLVDTCEAFAASLVRSVATLLGLLNAF